MSGVHRSPLHFRGLSHPLIRLMVLELGCFLAATAAILLPGWLLAGWLEVGRSPVERGSHGACLGLAAACYLGSAVSHFDLRWFFPVWGIFFLVVLAGFLITRRGRPKLDPSNRDIEIWVTLVLLLVGMVRFAFALPESYPRGWDPAFHMILAEKIRMTHHAIYDWLPFEDAGLNYPTGSHVLVVVISWMSGLPLPTVFKDLIPLLGVLTTAEIYAVSRRFTEDATAGLFAAIAYGFWAIDGSVGYALWGGMPNELGMLFFIAMFSIWLEVSGRGKSAGSVLAMGLLYGGVILVHHHVMVSSAIVLVVCLIWSMARGPAGAWKVLLLALIVAALLDGYFLVSFAGRAASIASTHIFRDDELPINPLAIPGDRLGYLYTLAALVGLFFWLARYGVKLDSRMICALATLWSLFIVGDYVVPAILHQEKSTVFTASRFLADGSYFMAAAAGAAAAQVARSLKVRVSVMSVVMLVLGITIFSTWKDIATMPDVAPDYVAACQWIKANTPGTAIVANSQPWTSYLAWRRTILTPIPISEPIHDRFARARQLMLVFAGKQQAEPGLYVVQIAPPGDYDARSVLWSDSTSVVLRLWPR
jgi:hypothetical protein